MTTFAHSVTIGPEFFAKAKRDYANQFWAFCREIMQNSLDAGSTLIDIRVVQMAELAETRVIVTNNGVPMEHAILTDKLLSLGSSGKDFRAGAVGGFGKAKEILYFTHKRYSISTGSYHVEGAGAGYNIEPSDEYTQGTTSQVVWEGCHASELIQQFKRFVWMMDRDCEVTINGEPVQTMIGRGRFKRNLMHEGNAWAEVRIVGGEANLLVVRVNGTPMFTSRSEYKRTVILELQGSSVTTLTANRDGLRWPFGGLLEDFMTTLAVDKRSALRSYEPTYHRHAGTRLRVPGRVDETVTVCVLDQAFPPAVAAALAGSTARSGAGIHDEVQGRHEHQASLLEFEFIIKDCLGKRAVPREFDPSSNAFSDHATWLARAWAGCLLELHQLYEISDPFSIGFIFSDEIAAEAENSSEYGRLYLVNPLVMSKRSHRRRFTKAKRHELIAEAAHEFVHGAFDLSRHNEDYAGKLTECLGTVLKHHRQFNRHVK